MTAEIDGYLFRILLCVQVQAGIPGDSFDRGRLTIFVAKKFKCKTQEEIHNNCCVNACVIFVIIVVIILLLIYFVKSRPSI